MANEILKENRILAAPVVIFLLAMLGFPAILDLIYSVSTVSFENLREPTLSGFGNYREVLSDPYFWSAVSFFYPLRAFDGIARNRARFVFGSVFGSVDSETLLADGHFHDADDHRTLHDGVDVSSRPA